MPKIKEASLGEHRQRLQGLILDAAESLLKSGGRQALTMGAVSERAGIARNSLYRYASNADQLADMVLVRRLPSWAEALNQALEGRERPDGVILAWAEANLRQAVAHGHSWLMDLFGAVDDESLRRSFLYASSEPGRDDIASDTEAGRDDPRQAMIRFYHLVNDPLVEAWRELVPDRAQTGVELTRGLVQSGMRLIDAQESAQGTPPNRPADPQGGRGESQDNGRIVADVLASVSAVTRTLADPGAGTSGNAPGLEPVDQLSAADGPAAGRSEKEGGTASCDS
ncbi:putative TetR family transcriptional regulator [Bifidobacterium actinocoloniiforme DSM 22766]|uniref:Putative TetR family transcriptional regulator n=1 Tax=Bifidobacterium actinocoloniiforme DSM 22766 TaxID=1437605 RepID=A0A086Z0Q0_9BIFI|nr:TetR/AcrR family transcriptional regulator [Bifidobacterium actinocoloniiforme]KFI40100.1 putative TetR family transcriptional regulator [Bifidobacterium actinocoloniiforme DSM 22766]